MPYSSVSFTALYLGSSLQVTLHMLLATCREFRRVVLELQSADYGFW